MRPWPSWRLVWCFLVLTVFGVLAADVRCCAALGDRLRDRTDEQLVQTHRFRLDALREGLGLFPTQDGSAALLTDGRGGVRASAGPRDVVEGLPTGGAEMREQAGLGRAVATGTHDVRAVIDRLPDGTYLVTGRSTAADESAVRTITARQIAFSVALVATLCGGVLWVRRRSLAMARETAGEDRDPADPPGSPDHPDNPDHPDSAETPASAGSARVTADAGGVVRSGAVTDPGTAVVAGGVGASRESREAGEATTCCSDESSRLRDLVGAASHELRTPLTTITGYAQLARIGGLEDPRRLDEAMGQVQSEMQRVTRLVEDMLLLARAERGGILEQEPVDLTELCERAVDRAQPADARHTLRCVTDSSPHLVLGDTQRLGQVIDSLLANVLAHTPARSSAELRLRREGRRHVIDVVDDGPGIPAGVRQRVFEPFFRGPAGTARTATLADVRPGHGLGLSVAAAVVTAHGGSIRLEPSERGAWFRVVLPPLTGAPGQEETAAREPSPRTPGRSGPGAGDRPAPC
ncbi:sensor histidine kinase [Streptomyces heilongjiangensis]|uniref:histidine kinase n=1 Tax=Streptomyces heilongjiangensis TaxID=945052 RepID=A0ABW1BK28_9ACTN|nr:HAMP domain-containing sensor histidine kinase [Streptomyces heilongjiangensis]MDC2951805.1 HAMP domain-containing sensor histidine kinase [Streptomyces heilongjiangensis]